MSYESERLKILEMIDNGLISVDEGVDLLKALDQRQIEPGSVAGSIEELPENPGLVVDNEKVVFSEPAPASQNPPEVTSSEEVAPEEEIVGEVGFEEQSADQPEPTMNFDAESSQSSEQVHAPQAEPALEEEFTSPKIDPNMLKWKGFWWIPFWAGVGVTIISTSLMYYAWFKGGFGFWFACTWFPFMLGVAVMALAYASRTARWLHVRVHQKPGEKPQNIAISLPIPLRLTAWFFRTFKGRIPQMGNTGIDELIMALEATNPETPFYVEVDEGENGERVEVYIG
jgi:hypothetical protein